MFGTVTQVNPPKFKAKTAICLLFSPKTTRTLQCTKEIFPSPIAVNCGEQDGIKRRGSTRGAEKTAAKTSPRSEGKGTALASVVHSDTSLKSFSFKNQKEKRKRSLSAQSNVQHYPAFNPRRLQAT